MNGSKIPSSSGILLFSANVYIYPRPKEIIIIHPCCTRNIYNISHYLQLTIEKICCLHFSWLCEFHYMETIFFQVFSSGYSLSKILAK